MSILDPYFRWHETEKLHDPIHRQNLAGGCCRRLDPGHPGLGYMMVLSASKFLQTPIVIMGIVVIAAIAYAFDHLVRFVERRVVPWKGRG